jgi:hypothetical protein
VSATVTATIVAAVTNGITRLNFPHSHGIR